MPQVTPSLEYQYIALGRLDETPNDPRLVRVKGAKINVEALARSVRALGILEPLVVRPRGKRFEILAGRRRYRAAKQAGLEAVPCVVRECDDKEAKAITITENVQRVQLHPLQEAEGIARLHDDGHSAEEIAADLGLSPATVHRRLKLRSLGACVRKAFTDPDSHVSAWSVRHLELIATYPESAQAEVIEAEWIRTVRDLQVELEREAHALSAAPWSLDDEDLVPEAGSCVACPRRSGATPSLFADLDSDLARGDSCLDRQCFQRKRAAHVKVAFERAQEKHGESLVAVTAFWSVRESAPALGVEVFPGTSGWTVAKKSDEGAVPAFDVESGRTQWVIFPKAGNGAKKPDPTTSDSIEAKLERAETLLRRKRLRHAVGALLENAEGAAVPKRETLLRLLGVFGGTPSASTRTGYLPSMWPKSLRKVGKSASPRWAVVEKAPDDDALAEEVWRGVQGVIAERLDLRQSFHDFDVVEAEADAYARLLGFDWPALWEGAREAHPPSKALVQRREVVKSAG